MGQKKPFKRDWLAEAIEIFDGKKVPVKKEHVVAVIHRYTELSQKTHKLAMTMQAAILKAEQKKDREWQMRLQRRGIDEQGIPSPHVEQSGEGKGKGGRGSVQPVPRTPKGSLPRG